MNYVYILYSTKDKKLYVGCTKDLKKRFSEHNKKRVISTKARTPLGLIFYESFINETDAFLREKWLKSGYGRTHLRKMLPETLKSLGG